MFVLPVVVLLAESPSGRIGALNLSAHVELQPLTNSTILVSFYRRTQLLRCLTRRL